VKVKKHPNGNEYIRAGDVWVRNFTKPEISAVQLDHMFEDEDFEIVLKNEKLNLNYPHVADEILNFKKIVIMSDGYDFDNRQNILAKIPKDVCILATNRSLAKWKLFSSKTPPDMRRTINGYVVNNPYRSAMSFLPPKDAKYFPTCIASIRTNCEFLKKYAGSIYTYMPTFETTFGFETPERYHVDDYRNPICAALGLAYQFGAKKIMLFCCDDSFKDKRDNAVQLPNGLWTYKPLLRSHEIIDANLWWLKKLEDDEVVVSDYSSGPEYVNAAYIKNEEEVFSFFTDQSEGVNDEKQTNLTKRV